MTIIGAALDRGVDVVTTNSDGSPERRALLLSRLGPGAVERDNRPWTCCRLYLNRLSVNGDAFPTVPRCPESLVWPVGSVVMDKLVFEIRQLEDLTRESPGRLVGTLMNYEERREG